jgi:hypothetical protein
MAEITYSRRNHIIGLIVLAIVYIVLVVLSIIGGFGFFLGSWLVAIIVYAVFWWLRGLPALAKWFPLFHYITLIVEFVYHCISLLYGIYWSIMGILALFKGFNLWSLLMIIAFIIITLTYALLVYVTLAVPYILLKGTVAQKAELAKEVMSSDAVNVPSQA